MSEIRIQGPGTIWRIRSIHDHPKLNVMLVADTQAEGVLEAIEQAAKKHGIDLERVSDAGADDDR